MSDEPLSFEEHRRRRREDAGSVRCARCGRWIIGSATTCPECGVHFQGEAQDFAHPSERGREAGTPGWVILLAVLLLVAMALGGLAVVG